MISESPVAPFRAIRALSMIENISEGLDSKFMGWG